MPGRFVAMIVAVVFVTIFAGFNLDNKCDLWFFHSFKSVPIFISVAVSFLAGIFLMIPFSFSRKKKITESDFLEWQSKKQKSEEKKAARKEKSRQRAILAQKKLEQKAKKSKIKNQNEKQATDETEIANYAQ